MDFLPLTHVSSASRSVTACGETQEKLLQKREQCLRNVQIPRMATFNLFDKIQMNSGVFAQFFQLIEAVVKAVSRSGAVCFVV